MRSGDDLDEIKARLLERLEELAEHLLGQPSAETRRKKDWKFPGHGGAFLVVRGPKRGAFYSFSDDAGGGPLDMVMYARSCSFGEAVRWARGFLGIAEDASQAAEDDAVREARARKRAEAQRQAEAEKAAKDQNGTAYARSIWSQAEGLSGTAAEAYLVQARCIPIPTHGWPHEAVRYHAPSRALILAARDDAGDVQAIQRVYLTPAGQKIDQAEVTARKLPAVKVTNGPAAGAAVRLLGSVDGPLLLAEGPETGLSVWTATGYETWIALGSMGKLELPEGRQVVVCTDDDKADKPAAKLLNKAISRWRAQRCKVAVATPWAVRRFDKTDFNDLLKASGAEAVHDRIAAALVRQPKARAPLLTVEAARSRLRYAVSDFFYQARGFNPDAEDGPPPIVHGIRAGVGTGKSAVSRIETAKLLAEMASTLAGMQRRGDNRTGVFAVPTHKLGDEQARDFEALPKAKAAGLTAAVWRGREAPDPLSPGKTMCLDMDAVKDVGGIGVAVEGNICFRRGSGGSEPMACPFYEECGYQRQKRATPSLWLVSHEMIFSQKAAAIGKVAVLVVDEAAWQDGLQGVYGKPEDLTLDTLRDDVQVPNDRTGLASDELREVHRIVGGMLSNMPDGPLERAGVSQHLSRETATAGRVLSWRRVVDPGLIPGMAAMERKSRVAAVAANRDAIRLSRLFGALEALLAPDGPEASGWASLVTVPTDDGSVRMIRLRGRRNVAKGWIVPTLILDALLDRRLVEPYWSQIEVTAEIEADTPHMRMRQLIGRDFSKASMVPDEWRENTPEEIRRREKNSNHVRATVLREARVGGGRALVVAQLAVENQWKAKGAPFPAAVDLAHHNAVAGRDEWGPGPGRDGVASLIVVGRTLPKPGDVERLAEALTGRTVAAHCQQYERHEVAIEMRDGEHATGEGFRHPDPIAEAIRWQICEGELLQIIGRGRGVNRTAANPLNVLVLTDTPLPLPIDELVTWEDLAPCPAALMLSEGGVVLANQEDMATAYPALWPNREAAKKATQRGAWGHSPYRNILKGECPQALLRVTYQRQGAGRRPAAAVVDPEAVPDPRSWLTKRLGNLAACDASDAFRPEAEVPGPPVAEPEPVKPVGAWWDQPTAAAAAEAVLEPPADPSSVAAEFWLTPAPAKPVVPATADDDGIDWLKPPPLLHPPLPGEDLHQRRPPPAQAGLLGVILGRQAVPVDPYPEPGSYEPDEEELLPVLPGTPLPNDAPRAWWFDLQRRKAAVPLPDMSIGWPANHFREERWKAAVAEVEAAWNIEWQVAWVAGSRLPPAEEGTTT